MNCAMLLPPATCTTLGTVSCRLGDEICAVAPALGAGPANVAVHVALPPPVNSCELQTTAVNEKLPLVSGWRVSVCEAPPCAVTETVVLAVTAAAFMINVAAVKLGAIVIDWGIVRLLLDELSPNVTAVRAGLAIVMVHAPAPGVEIVVGVQSKVAGGSWLMLMVVGVPVRPRLLPLPSVELRFDSVICDEVFVVDEDI